MRLKVVQLLGLLAAFAACDGLSHRGAIRVVRAYNDRVIDAFRTGDARLVEGVAGPAEAQRLLGLIGVKTDAGTNLDAQLLQLAVLSVARHDDAVVVDTDERWHYVDRRIGSGEQVGAASDDHYHMKYFLRRIDRRWLVDAIQFVGEPEVGRREGPLRTVSPAFHSLGEEKGQ